MEMFSSRHGLPSAWILFSLPRLFPRDQSSQWVTEFSDLSANSAISLELKVFLASPEADWSFLVKVRRFKKLILIKKIAYLNQFRFF